MVKSGHSPSPTMQIVGFLRKVKDWSDDEKCWVWSGASKGNGYGHCAYQGKYMGAHRKSFYCFMVGQYLTQWMFVTVVTIDFV